MFDALSVSAQLLTRGTQCCLCDDSTDEKDKKEAHMCVVEESVACVETEKHFGGEGAASHT